MSGWAWVVGELHKGCISSNYNIKKIRYNSILMYGNMHEEVISFHEWVVMWVRRWVGGHHSTMSHVIQGGGV